MFWYGRCQSDWGWLGRWVKFLQEAAEGAQRRQRLVLGLRPVLARVSGAQPRPQDAAELRVDPTHRGPGRLLAEAAEADLAATAEHLAQQGLLVPE